MTACPYHRQNNSKQSCLILTLCLLFICPLSWGEHQQIFQNEVPDFIRDCMDCHGKNGVSPENDVPIIAGLSAAYHKASLYAYRNKQRPAIATKYRAGDITRDSTNMKTIADTLTDQQITYISLYFAAQRFIPAKQNFNPLLVAQGERIHQSQCRRCHKQGGSRASDDTGLLAGQWSRYLQETMIFYLNGSREIEKKMKIKLDKLSDSDWQALVAYYASQQ